MRRITSYEMLVHYKLGVDLVEVKKIRRVFAGRESSQEAVFTEAELRRSLRRRNRYACLAACFAAKEALFKALGTGLSGDMDWRDVEIDEENPAGPVIRLQGRTAQDARAKGVVCCAVSLSSTKNYAASLVVLVAGAAGLHPHPLPGVKPRGDRTTLRGRERGGRG